MVWLKLSMFLGQSLVGAPGDAWDNMICPKEFDSFHHWNSGRSSHKSMPF